MLSHLAIETSVREYSVSLNRGEQSFVKTYESGFERASTGLLPEIQSLLKAANCQPTDINAIGVSLGPGSFTGLRMGVSTAKTLAWALNCEIYGLSTHTIIACQAAQELASVRQTDHRKIVTLIDAQRGQWFAEAFTCTEDGLPESQGPSTIVNPAEYLADLSEPCLICGPALHRWHQKIDFPDNIKLARPEFWLPQAETLSSIMVQYKSLLSAVNALELVPMYGRKSAAEEKWLAGELK